VTRVFGVKRGDDDFSAGNLMPARAFFSRYPEILPVLRGQLREGADIIAKTTSAVHPKEAALMPPLAVLAKLKPGAPCEETVSDVLFRPLAASSAFDVFLRVELISSSTSSRACCELITTLRRSP